MPQVVRGIAGAVVVEAHPIDQCPIVGQTEQARRGIAGLGLSGDGAHLGEAEAHRSPRVDAGRVLVEPGGKPDRCREVDAERRGAQCRIVDDEHLGDQCTDRREPRHDPHRGEREVMDAFRGSGTSDAEAGGTRISLDSRCRNVMGGLAAAEQDPTAAVGVQADA